MATRRLARQATALACGLVTAGGVFATPAVAHTGLTGSSPEDGGTVSAPPERLSLSFSDPMDSRYSRVAVEDPSGDSVTTGPVEVAGKTVTRALQYDAPSGRYTVAYRVVSADGHPVAGSFTYRIAAPTSTSAPDAGKTPGANASPTAGGPSKTADGPSEEKARENPESLPGWMKTVLAVFMALLLAGATFMWWRGVHRGD